MEPPEQSFRFCIAEDKDMIVKISYKLKRTLPGEQYDYEELYAESVLQETEQPKSPQEMLDEVVNLVRTNTAVAKLKAKKTSGEV